jgi:hypothetical protein
MATGTCYWYSQFGQFSHFSKVCAGKGVAQKPLVPTQVYALIPTELEGGLEIVTSTTPILGFEASVFFFIRGLPTLLYLLYL